MKEKGKRVKGKGRTVTPTVVAGHGRTPSLRAGVDARDEAAPVSLPKGKGKRKKGKGKSAASDGGSRPSPQTANADGIQAAACPEGAEQIPPPEVRRRRTKSEAMREHWRKIRAGLLPHPGEKVRPRASLNPLLDLSEEDRGKLFTWLRECPYDDAVKHILAEQGIVGITAQQLNQFFQSEAEHHWQKRIGRAAQEANALVQLVEKSPVRFSSGILAALGQEAFRQISSGRVEPEAMGKLATLFLRARSDERADQMQELRREKLRRELQGQIDHALEKLAEEVDRNPVARDAFAALRRELESSLQEGL